MKLSKVEPLYRSNIKTRWMKLWLVECTVVTLSLWGASTDGIPAFAADTSGSRVEEPTHDAQTDSNRSCESANANTNPSQEVVPSKEPILDIADQHFQLGVEELSVTAGNGTTEPPDEELDEVTALNRRAAKLLKSKKYDEALTATATALSLEPRNEISLTAQVVIYTAKGESDNAFKACEALLKAFPNSHWAWYARGLNYVHLSKLDDAQLNFDKAIQLAPSEGVYYLSRAQAYELNGKPQEAIEDYSQFVTLEPENPESYLYRAKCYLRLGQLEEVLIDVNQMIRLDPHNAKYYMYRARILLDQGDFKSAERDFEQACRIAPNDSRFLPHYAYFLCTCSESGLRDYPKAVELANKSCILTGWQSAWQIDVLALAHAQASGFDSAIKFGKMALALSKSDEERNRRQRCIRKYEARENPFPSDSD